MIGLDLEKQANLKEAGRLKQIELEEARKKKIAADRKAVNDAKRVAEERVVNFLEHSIAEVLSNQNHYLDLDLDLGLDAKPDLGA